MLLAIPLLFYALAFSMGYALDDLRQARPRAYNNKGPSLYIDGRPHLRFNGRAYENGLRRK
eukprot:scaffold16346_cov73-Isochrysis_galbana.AAC.1